jgi:3-dehydroquinate dehydratase-2
MAERILVLNGPNLNMLGRREPEQYGRLTLAEIETASHDHAAALGCNLDFRQSNLEGELVTWIQSALEDFDGIIINPGAYTHTSIAIHDAIRAAGKPVIELHLSNVFAREAFRHTSYVSPVALAVMCGFGADGYRLALDGLVSHLRKNAA